MYSIRIPINVEQTGPTPNPDLPHNINSWRSRFTKRLFRKVFLFGLNRFGVGCSSWLTRRGRKDPQVLRETCIEILLWTTLPEISSQEGRNNTLDSLVPVGTIVVYPLKINYDSKNLSTRLIYLGKILLGCSLFT